MLFFKFGSCLFVCLFILSPLLNRSLLGHHSLCRILPLPSDSIITITLLYHYHRTLPLLYFTIGLYSTIGLYHYQDLTMRFHAGFFHPLGPRWYSFHEVSEFLKFSLFWNPVFSGSVIYNRMLQIVFLVFISIKKMSF